MNEYGAYGRRSDDWPEPYRPTRVPDPFRNRIHNYSYGRGAYNTTTNNNNGGPPGGPPGGHRGSFGRSDHARRGGNGFEDASGHNLPPGFGSRNSPSYPSEYHDIGPVHGFGRSAHQPFAGPGGHHPSRASRHRGAGGYRSSGSSRYAGPDGYGTWNYEYLARNDPGSSGTHYYRVRQPVYPGVPQAPPGIDRAPPMGFVDSWPADHGFAADHRPAPYFGRRGLASLPRVYHSDGNSDDGSDYHPPGSRRGGFPSGNGSGDEDISAPSSSRYASSPFNRGSAYGPTSPGYHNGASYPGMSVPRDNHDALGPRPGSVRVAGFAVGTDRAGPPDPVGPPRSAGHRTSSAPGSNGGGGFNHADVPPSYHPDCAQAQTDTRGGPPNPGLGGPNDNDEGFGPGTRPVDAAGTANGLPAAPSAPGDSNNNHNHNHNHNGQVGRNVRVDGCNDDGAGGSVTKTPGPSDAVSFHRACPGRPSLRLELPAGSVAGRNRRPDSTDINWNRELPNALPAGPRGPRPYMGAGLRETSRRARDGLQPPLNAGAPRRRGKTYFGSRRGDWP